MNEGARAVPQWMQSPRKKGAFFVAMIPGLRVVSQARCPAQREMTLN